MPEPLRFRVDSYDTLVSTQDAMRARLEAGEEVHGLVIRAAQQTRGRGRRTRGWSSGLGGSYQTLALRDRTGRLRRPHTALAMALGLAEVLTGRGVRVGIKWPNDLYLEGKKLAGILSEYLHGYLLVGIGVNVVNEVPEGATGLPGWEVSAVHEVVLEGVRCGLELFAAEAELPARFNRYDLLYEQAVLVTVGGRSVGGVAKGIDTSGCLQLVRQGDRHEVVCHGRLRAYRLRQLAARW